MTFDELVEEVFLLTDRRDLTAETKSAVKAATLKAHQSDFYSKDIFETGVEFTDKNFRQSLDYVSLLSNFRAFKYFRIVQDQNDDAGTFLEIISPDEILDSYGQGRRNIAYVAGRVLEIRSATEFTKALLGCYVNPIVREGAYISWVAEQFPYAIVYEAVRTLFKTIGYDEQAATYSQLTGEAYSLLKMSGLSDVGY